MAKIRDFVKREVVLCAAFAAALVSAFLVPPDGEYLGYIDLRTLALLYCLMVVVAGIRSAGTFARLAHVLCGKAGSVRALAFVLVLLSFFSAMFITNDVALLTFVPFAVVVLGLAHEEKELIRVVVLQTVAANLGSMLTPVGNPQNIYIQSFYSLGTGDFVKITLPVWLASLALISLMCVTAPKTKPELFLGEKPILRGGRLGVYGALFAVCLLAVVRVIGWQLMLLTVAAVLAVYDRKGLLKADFLLLLTFVFFFIFSGNLARIELISTALRRVMQGREYLIGLLASQVISNVPAALLLSGFTDNAPALLLGVNIGGLGTPIASLASLISLKLYGHAEHADTGKFLLWFTVVNVALLLVLSGIALLLL